MHAPFGADREYRHNVRMIERPRRAGFVLKPIELLFVEHRGKRQHLERHPTSNRNLLGLVDHAHPAPTDFLENAEVAELTRDRSAVVLFMLRGRCRAV